MAREVKEDPNEAAFRTLQDATDEDDRPRCPECGVKIDAEKERRTTGGTFGGDTVYTEKHYRCRSCGSEIHAS